jgi:hypothetical protein
MYNTKDISGWEKTTLSNKIHTPQTISEQLTSDKCENTDGDIGLNVIVQVISGENADSQRRFCSGRGEDRDSDVLFEVCTDILDFTRTKITNRGRTEWSRIEEPPKGSVFSLQTWQGTARSGKNGLETNSHKIGNDLQEELTDKDRLGTEVLEEKYQQRWAIKTVIGH